MYPIGRTLKIDDGTYSKDHKYTVDQIRYIFVDPECGKRSETHTVKEWLSGFDIVTEDHFFVKWHSCVHNVGRRMKKIVESTSMKTADETATYLFFILYIHYEHDKVFEEQFEENVKVAEEMMKKLIP